MFDTPYFEGKFPPGHERDSQSSLKTKKLQKNPTSARDPFFGIIDQNAEGECITLSSRLTEGPSNRRADKRHTVVAVAELKKSRAAPASAEEEDASDNDGETTCSEGAEPPMPRASATTGSASTSLWTLKLTSTVKQRVSRLRHARRLFQDYNKGGDSGAPMRASQRAKIFLPESDVKSLKEVWKMYDEDDSGDLDSRECADVIADLGLKPRTRDEKMELAEIMEEFQGSDDHVDFTQLCAIVQRLRAKVQESQTKNLFTIFQKHDTDDSSALDKNEVLVILGELMLAPTVPEEEHAIIDLMAEVDADDSGELEFPEFVTLVTKVTERLQILRRQRELAIKEEYKLDNETFRQYRAEILKLKRLFDSFDKDDSGALDMEEVKEFIAEVGLMPANKRERDMVDSNCEEMEQLCDGDFNFKQVLLLTQKLRRTSIENSRGEMRRLFMSYDKDRSGELSFGEVSKVLGDMGLTPSNRQQQEEIARMMEEADDDGSMELTFEEFLRLQQMITEKLKAMQREYEKEQAFEMLFTEDQLADLRNAFDVLDQDGSGSLDVSEVRRALQLMGKKVTSDRLRELMSQIEGEGRETGELDFIGFMTLVRIIEGPPDPTQRKDKESEGGADSPKSRRRAVADRRTTASRGLAYAPKVDTVEFEVPR